MIGMHEAAKEPNMNELNHIDMHILAAIQRERLSEHVLRSRVPAGRSLWPRRALLVGLFGLIPLLLVIVQAVTL
jgi:hypothetical protein